MDGGPQGTGFMKGGREDINDRDEREK